MTKNKEIKVEEISTKPIKDEEQKQKRIQALEAQGYRLVKNIEIYNNEIRRTQQQIQAIEQQIEKLKE